MKPFTIVFFPFFKNIINLFKAMSFLVNWSLLLIPVPVLPTLGAAASSIERNLSCKSCKYLFLGFS